MSSKIFDHKNECLPEIMNMERTVNGSTPNVKNVAFSFLHFHRTLQQNLIRLLYNVIKTLAAYYEEQGMPAVSDMRNENSVNWIKEVAKIEAYFPFV